MSWKMATSLPTMPRQPDVLLHTMYDDVIVTPVSLDNLHDNLMLSLSHQFPWLIRHSKMSLMTCHIIILRHSEFVGRIQDTSPSFVNATTSHPLPSTLEPKTVTQALKDSLCRQAMDDEFNTLLCNHT
ncbi:hypothetical protein V6N11_050538 [Hibiscus sabdariffa]